MVRAGLPRLRTVRSDPTGRGHNITHGPESGFGLIELIVAMTVFSILVGGLVVSMGAGLALARSNRQRSVAANLASKEVDAIRQAPFTSLTVGLTPSTVAVDGVNFAVSRNLEWVGNAATSGECDSTATTPQVLRVTVDVSWTNMKYVQPVHTSTVLSPPVGAYDPNTGHVAVRVRDSDATPLGAVPVRVQGTGIDRTLNTTDAFAASPGCAFFGFLPAGNYTVTLGAAGYVDRQGSASPSQSVGVNVGQVTSVGFDYDRAATLTVSLVSALGGTPANGVTVSLGNTGYIPSGVKAFPGVGTPRNLTNLYPFNDGYDAWAGDCVDADPEGKDPGGNPYWPGAQRADPLTVNPAATTTGTVALPTLRVRFNQSGAPDGTDTIVAVHAPDSRCASGSTLTLTTFPINTGTTLVALPYGTWTIKAVGKSPSGSWPSVILDPNASSIIDANVNI